MLYARGVFLMVSCAFYLSSAPSVFPRDAELYEEGWNYDLSGYYKNIFMYQEREEFVSGTYSVPEEKRLISDMNRFRLSPEMNYAGNLILHADLDFRTVSANYKGSNEFDTEWIRSQYNEPLKTEVEIADTEDHYAVSDLQSLYARIIAGEFTGTAGRQQIRFGNSRLWNPLDLLAPFSPLSVEGADEQRGIDALRLDWYHGEYLEVTGVAAPMLEHDSYEKAGAGSGNYIVRFKSGVQKADYAFLYGYTSKRRNAGGDFAAEVYDGLLTGTILYSEPVSGEEYWQAGTGYEYTFNSGLYILFEYFYNSLPVSEDAELAAALYHLYTDGVDESSYYIISNRIITCNSHYASVAAGYDFHPLLRGELFSVYDFQGDGLFVNTSLKLNALENLDLTAGVITAFVSKTARVSDFNKYDGEPLYYASLQFYF